MGQTDETMDRQFQIMLLIVWSVSSSKFCQVFTYFIEVNFVYGCLCLEIYHCRSLTFLLNPQIGGAGLYKVSKKCYFGIISALRLEKSKVTQPPSKVNELTSFRRIPLRKGATVQQYCMKNRTDLFFLSICLDIKHVAKAGVRQV